MRVAALLLLLGLAISVGAVDRQFGFKFFSTEPFIPLEIWRKAVNVCQTGKKQSPVDLKPDDVTVHTNYKSFMQFANVSPSTTHKVSAYNFDGIVYFALDLTASPPMIAGGAAWDNKLTLIGFYIVFGDTPLGSDHSFNGRKSLAEIVYTFVDLEYLEREGSRLDIQKAVLLRKFLEVHVLVEGGTVSDEGAAGDDLRGMISGVAENHGALAGAETNFLSYWLGQVLSPVLYYHYTGSFTGMTCTEGLPIVLEERTVKMSLNTLVALQSVKGISGQPVGSLVKPQSSFDAPDQCHTCKCSRVIDHLDD